MGEYIQGNGQEQPDGRKHPFVAQEWNQRHDIAVMLQAAGFTNTEISEQLGFDAAYVSRILNDPRAVERREEFSKKLSDELIDVGLRFKLAANEALGTAMHWMRQRHPQLAPVSVRAAFGLLDRAGYTKIEKHLVAHVDLTPDELERMERLSIAANDARGKFDYSDVQEAEVVEVENGSGTG